MIQKTSAVTTTVLGEVKIVGLLILSALLLGKPMVLTCIHNHIIFWPPKSCMHNIDSLSLMLLTCLDTRAACTEAIYGPLGEKKAFTFKMTVGVTLAMVGFCMYSHTKLRLRPQPAKVQAAEKPIKSQQDVEEGQALISGQEQLTPRVHHK